MIYIFSWEPALWTLMSLDRVLLLTTMVMMSKKSIAIFGYKQWHLRLDMKTKVVQHVPRINLSYLKFQIFKFFKNFQFSNFWKFSNFQTFSGSQLLSDFQTFFLTKNEVFVQRMKLLVQISNFNFKFWNFLWFPAFVWLSDIFLQLLPCL